MPVTTRTNDEACGLVSKNYQHSSGYTYSQGQANQQVIRRAILQLHDPVIDWRDAVVNQTIQQLDDDGVENEACELQCGYKGRCGVRDGADVGGAQGTGLDQDEEAADRQQDGRDDVARGFAICETDDALEQRLWA